MALVIDVLHAWVVIVILVMLAYAVRHWIFSISRMTAPQRPYYQDLFDGDLPAVTVLVPMHDEELVARDVLDSLLASDYPAHLLEIIPIDDHSCDGTKAILESYPHAHANVHPLFLNGEGMRGKPGALNAGLEAANHPVVVVFDADYLPGRGLVRELVAGFADPEVGAVMGRVVPRNTPVNVLTRLLSLERAGGYQVDQQARYNMDLFPQYGGTVGGFRRDLVKKLGGFRIDTLAEDTDLTARLFIAGYRIAYANRAECYEDVPSTWTARFDQLRRWSAGHNKALQRNFFPLLFAKHLSLRQRLDGAMTLAVYMIPPLLITGFIANMLLFWLGAIGIVSGAVFLLIVVGYSAFGNFAPIYEIGVAEILDGAGKRLLLLPYMFWLFIFNSWAVTRGAADAIVAPLRAGAPHWAKTAREVGDRAAFL
jgi:cellulose synthase/poly-beta-1,6-N-acetylglucosamine synthase-like glycosyltransferase